MKLNWAVNLSAAGGQIISEGLAELVLKRVMNHDIYRGSHPPELSETI